MAKKKLPDNLRDLRESLHLTINHAAFRIGCDRVTLWRLENNHSQYPNARILYGMSDAYDMDVRDLKKIIEKQNAQPKTKKPKKG